MSGLREQFERETWQRGINDRILDFDKRWMPIINDKARRVLIPFSYSSEAGFRRDRCDVKKQIERKSTLNRKREFSWIPTIEKIYCESHARSHIINLMPSTNNKLNKSY